MRIVKTGLIVTGFALASLLTACGHDQPGPSTLSVTCDGSLMLAGAASVSAAYAAGGTGATLSFPDPVNPGQTGTLPIPPGHSCVINPVDGKANSGDARGPHKAGS